MEARYQKNIGSLISEQVQDVLLTKVVAVIGCGGVGGYILEFLARLGIKEIIFWDGDIFNESNLNRQLGCTVNTLGKNKAVVLKERLTSINPKIKLNCCDWFFGERQIDFMLLLKANIIINAADINYNCKQNRTLLRKALLKNIPIIEGAGDLLGGFVTIYTANTLDFFDNRTQYFLNLLSIKNIVHSGCPAYKIALVAAEVINQLVQYFSNSRFANIDSTLCFDIYHHKYNQFDKFGEF